VIECGVDFDFFVFRLFLLYYFFFVSSLVGVEVFCGSLAYIFSSGCVLGEGFVSWC